MSAPAIKIVGLTLADRKAWDNGDRPLAYFDCETGGFRLHGCTLIRTSRGFLLAQAPRGESQRPGTRAIQIVDTDLRKGLADAAYSVFQSFGGAE
jgi:hypothetical protein